MDWTAIAVLALAAFAVGLSLYALTHR